MNKIITLFILMFSSLAFSQGITISKISNDKKNVTITNGNYVAVQVQGLMHNDEPCSNIMELYGAITKRSEDSLYVQVKHLEMKKSIDGKHSRNRIYWEDNYPIQKVLISDIINIETFKSEKVKKRSENILGISALLMGTGIVTSLSSLLAKDKQSRQTILWAGAAQFTLGITLGIFSQSSKDYGFKYEDDPWKFE